MPGDDCPTRPRQEEFERVHPPAGHPLHPAMLSEQAGYEPKGGSPDGRTLPHREPLTAS